MGFLEKINLIMKYNKGSMNKMVVILSRAPIDNITTLGTLMHMESSTHYAYKEEYIEDEDFKDVF